MNDTPWGRVAAEKLQMSARIAELEAQLAATPPAWGPPQAQPDSVGWWACQGKIPQSLPYAEAYGSLFRVWEYHGQLLAHDNMYDSAPVTEFRGTWRKLHMPWEVKP